jgi:hypothetical protein
VKSRTNRLGRMVLSSSSGVVTIQTYVIYHVTVVVTVYLRCRCVESDVVTVRVFHGEESGEDVDADRSRSY